MQSKGNYPVWVWTSGWASAGRRHLQRGNGSGRNLLWCVDRCRRQPRVRGWTQPSLGSPRRGWRITHWSWPLVSTRAIELKQREGRSSYTCFVCLYSCEDFHAWLWTPASTSDCVASICAECEGHSLARRMIEGDYATMATTLRVNILFLFRRQQKRKMIHGRGSQDVIAQKSQSSQGDI